jgi:hypothetical protein
MNSNCPSCPNHCSNGRTRCSSCYWGGLLSCSPTRFPSYCLTARYSSSCPTHRHCRSRCRASCPTPSCRRIPNRTRCCRTRRLSLFRRPTMRCCSRQSPRTALEPGCRRPIPPPRPSRRRPPCRSLGVSSILASFFSPQPYLSSIMAYVFSSSLRHARDTVISTWLSKESYLVSVRFNFQRNRSHKKNTLVKHLTALSSLWSIGNALHRDNGVL